MSHLWHLAKTTKRKLHISFDLCRLTSGPNGAYFLGFTVIVVFGDFYIFRFCFLFFPSSLIWAILQNFSCPFYRHSPHNSTLCSEWSSQEFRRAVLRLLSFNDLNPSCLCHYECQSVRKASPQEHVAKDLQATYGARFPYSSSRLYYTTEGGETLFVIWMCDYRKAHCAEHAGSTSTTLLQPTISLAFCRSYPAISPPWEKMEQGIGWIAIHWSLIVGSITYF